MKCSNRLGEMGKPWQKCHPFMGRRFDSCTGYQPCVTGMACKLKPVFSFHSCKPHPLKIELLAFVWHIRIQRAGYVFAVFFLGIVVKPHTIIAFCLNCFFSGYPESIQELNDLTLTLELFSTCRDMVTMFFLLCCRCHFLTLQQRISSK